MVSAVAAVELQPQTRQAYERYVEQATNAFLERVRSGGGRIALRDGEVNARPGRSDGIVGVPGGLVHHWIGSTFIAGATLDDGLAISQSYGDYQKFYKAIVASRFVGREGNVYTAEFRIKEGSSGVSAVLDVKTRVEYVRLDNVSAYSISMAEEIREVKNAGRASERLLPAGRDSGYLWQAATLNRLVQLADGLFVEMETFGLSRTFPPMLGWLIEPIARRLGRKSVEVSLQEFRIAIRARTRG